MKNKKFQVLVTRTSYSSIFIDVEAKNESEAKEKAINEAGDHEFPEHDAEYEVDSIEKIQQQKRK